MQLGNPYADSGTLRRVAASLRLRSYRLSYDGAGEQDITDSQELAEAANLLIRIADKDDAASGGAR